MKPGDLVHYRSLAGDLWPATVLAIRPDGRADLNVDDLKLTDVAVFDGPARECTKATCCEANST